MKILNLIEWKISQCGIKDGSVISWADTEMLRFFWDFTIWRVWLAAGLKKKIHQMRIKWSWTSAFTRIYYKIIQCQRDEILFQFFQIIKIFHLKIKSFLIYHKKYLSISLFVNKLKWSVLRFITFMKVCCLFECSFSLFTIHYSNNLLIHP